MKSNHSYIQRASQSPLHCREKWNTLLDLKLASFVNFIYLSIYIFWEFCSEIVAPFVFLLNIMFFEKAVEIAFLKTLKLICLKLIFLYF
jgi:hypothetical protein